MRMPEKIVFVDLETTGANPLIDRITEIGVVEVIDGQARHWSTLVNPGMPIPPFIQSLTGIRDDMVANAPAFAEIAEELLLRLHDGLFIAHNARFDYGFLRNAFKDAGYAWRTDALCTVKLSRKLFPHEARHNLDALVARHGLIAKDRHRALADADLLWQFWRKLGDEIAPADFAAAVAQLLQRPSLPPHLPQDALDDVPDAPGVYLFYGDNGAPLYVGKSVHLRQRVLSHFNADHRLYKDLRISHQIHRLEWRETAGEIGALLLEAQLIKDLQPIHNRMLRRQRALCAWQLPSPDAASAPPLLARAADVDFGRTARLYGLFGSATKAQAALRELAQRHDLCLVMLGLETRTHAGKPCFAHQLRQCRGACVGRESNEAHFARLEQALAALALTSWPYDGAVGLVERGAGGKSEIHVVDNWCYLGSTAGEEGIWQRLAQSPRRPAFDVDTYKILLRAITQGQLELRTLPRRPLEAAA